MFHFFLRFPLPLPFGNDSQCIGMNEPNTHTQPDTIWISIEKYYHILLFFVCNFWRGNYLISMAKYRIHMNSPHSVGRNTQKLGKKWNQTKSWHNWFFLDSARSSARNKIKMMNKHVIKLKANNKHHIIYIISRTFNIWSNRKKNKILIDEQKLIFECLCVVFSFRYPNRFWRKHFIAKFKAKRFSPIENRLTWSSQRLKKNWHRYANRDEMAREWAKKTTRKQTIPDK